MKKKIVVLLTGALICASALLCTGCGDIVSKYIDEETADVLVAKGKSIAAEEASSFMSDFKESSSEIISEVVETAKQKQEELEAEYKDKAAAEASDGAGALDEASEYASAGILSSTADINLRDPEGKDKNYVFDYDGEEYSAVYWSEHWKVLDSYKINSADDMIIICQALIDVHPVHGSDMESYRTAEDMAYEWLQHNLAYAILPDDNSWKSHSKDVDFNPEDQGKTFYEIYEQRTGKEFKFSDFLGG